SHIRGAARICIIAQGHEPRALALRAALAREAAEASERTALNGRAEENDEIVFGGERIAECAQTPVQIAFGGIGGSAWIGGESGDRRRLPFPRGPHKNLRPAVARPFAGDPE